MIFFSLQESILTDFYVWPALICLWLHKLSQELNLFILQPWSKCALSSWSTTLTESLLASQNLWSPWPKSRKKQITWKQILWFQWKTYRHSSFAKVCYAINFFFSVYSIPASAIIQFVSTSLEEKHVFQL